MTTSGANISLHREDYEQAAKDGFEWALLHREIVLPILAFIMGWLCGKFC